jgi:hypothetical protein
VHDLLELLSSVFEHGSSICNVLPTMDCDRAVQRIDIHRVAPLSALGRYPR